MKRFAIVAVVAMAALFSACPAVEVRCKCPPESSKDHRYPKPPEIHEVGQRD